jgi:hypothetical protein
LARGNFIFPTPAYDQPQKTHRSRPALGGDQQGFGAGEIHPARTSEHAPFMVGAAAVGGARAVIFSQMVDDPSAYVDELKGDAKLKRRAETILKARHRIWQEATAVLEKATAAGIAAPAPGPEPKIDDILAEQERNRLFKIIEDLVLWENTTNETVLQAAREEIWQAAHLRGECRSSAGERTLRPAHAARLPRSVCRRRRAAAGGAAARAGEPCQRPQPRGRAHQQGHDRDSAEVRGPAAGESRVENRE